MHYENATLMETNRIELKPNSELLCIILSWNGITRFTKIETQTNSNVAYFKIKRNILGCVLQLEHSAFLAYDCSPKVQNVDQYVASRIIKRSY